MRYGSRKNFSASSLVYNSHYYTHRVHVFISTVYCCIGIVQAASVVGVLTGPERVAPVMEAVLAQIRLKADLFLIFMDILRSENSNLADIVQQEYGK